MNARDSIAGVWCEITRRHRCDDASAQVALDYLARAYDEPHRHYHTLDHVADLIALMECHGGASDSDAIKLAILFHDAVYNPMRNDNEAASAELAERQLTELGIPEPLLSKVDRYIRATQHSISQPVLNDPDLELLLDLDLSILGASPDRYRAYAQAIRREYAAVPERFYASGRRQVLERFLASNPIYRTKQLRTLWEAQARENLSAELAKLP